MQSAETNYNPQTATLDEELNEYKNDNKFDPKTNDCLFYWRNNSNKYPVLSQVVRRLFSYQATSVPSERLFSAAGYTVWDRRASLKPEKVNMLMVINQYELNTRV